MNTEITPDNILFRCSALGSLMSDPQGKTNKEKYAEAQEKLTKWKLDYSILANKETKSAKKLLERIQKANQTILELEKIKDRVELSETAKKQIAEVYGDKFFGRREEIDNKFLSKGNEREEDAITLFSLVTKIPFFKNKERLNNEFITGEPDIFTGESIFKAEETFDTKCCWSLNTFLKTMVSNSSNSDYEWQGLGYMDLSGAKKHTIVYCLVNGTFTAINDEIRRAAWKMGVLDTSIENNPLFVKKVQQIEVNHIFDIDSFMKENPHYQPANPVEYDGEKFTWAYDIPKEKRVYCREVYRDDEEIIRIHNRVKEARIYMKEKFFSK